MITLNITYSPNPTSRRQGRIEYIHHSTYMNILSFIWIYYLLYPSPTTLPPYNEIFFLYFKEISYSFSLILYQWKTRQSLSSIH